MTTQRIKRTHHRGEVYPNVWSDFKWIGEHRKELFETYGEVIILVYQQQVVGVGKTLEEAEVDAELQLAPDVEQITPVTYFVTSPYRLQRKLLSRIQDE